VILVGVRLSTSKHQEESIEIWKGTEQSKHILSFTRDEALQLLIELEGMLREYT